MTRDDRRDRLLLAVQQELKVRPPFERNRHCGHDDRGAEIAAHRVNRYANVARHSQGPTAILGRVARAAPGAARQ